MMAVNETVLEHQLEIVNKKMQKYEDELYKKIEDKVKILMFEFDHAKSEISVGFRIYYYRLIEITFTMSLSQKLVKGENS